MAVQFSGSLNLTGSLQVTTSITSSRLKVDGLNYPTTDGGVSTYISSDGAGNLSLQYVHTIYETARNMESFTLAKGTPIFISGSTGANPNAYLADPGNPLRRPAVYVAGEDLAPSQTGLAIVLGLIEGVNTNSYPPGTEIYLKQGGGWTATRPTGSNTDVQVLGYVTKQGTGGQGVFLNPGPVNLPNLREGYLWVGGINSYPTASLATASLELSGRGIVSSSTQIQNYNLFALTASANTFYGNQTITGSLTLSSGSITMPNRPAFRVIGNSSTDRVAPTILSGSYVTIDYNEGNHFNSTNGLFTAPIAGLYQIYYNGRAGSVNSQMQVIIHKNTNVSQLMWEAPGNTGVAHFGVSGVVKLAAGDTLQASVVIGSIQFDGNNSWGAAYIG